MSWTNCLLLVVAFMDLFAVGLVVPLIPSHVRQMGANHVYVGLLGSIYAGFQFFSGPIIGSLSDLKGRRIILIITLFISSIAYVLMGFTSSVALILILRAVLGLFKQTQMLTKALVPDYENNELVQSDIYGKMAAVSGVGITLGPVIGGHIVEDYPQYGFPFITLIVAVTFIANAGLVYILPKPNRHKKKKVNPTNSSESITSMISNSLKQSVIDVYKVNWTKYWDAFLFKGIVGFVMGVYYSNYALYLKTEFDITQKYIGYVISFQGVIGSLVSYFMGYINSYYKKDKDYSERNFHVFLLLCLSFLGIILTHNVYIYLIWLVPLAIGNAIGRLITLEMVLKRSHGDHRGTLIGASNSVRSLSGVIAPMTAGAIAQIAGVRYVIYAALIPALFGSLLSYRRRIKILKKD